MSSPFYKRKWAGIPYTEEKRLPPDEPSKLAPRASSSQPRPNIRKVDIYSGGGWSSWWERVPLPYFDVEVARHDIIMGAEHERKRMKAVCVQDKTLDIFWLEDNHKQPVSPEFSDRENMIRWLVYRGFDEGHLFIERYTRPRRGVVFGISGR